VVRNVGDDPANARVKLRLGDLPERTVSGVADLAGEQFDVELPPRISRHLLGIDLRGQLLESLVISQWGQLGISPRPRQVVVAHAPGALQPLDRFFSIAESRVAPGDVVGYGGRQAHRAQLHRLLECWDGTAEVADAVTRHTQLPPESTIDGVRLGHFPPERGRQFPLLCPCRRLSLAQAAQVFRDAIPIDVRGLPPRAPGR
jgi:hypothetical protein